MKKKRDGFKIGDVVKVKEGIMDPDFEGVCIGGWQGRISEITETKDGTPLVGIQWDSITLKSLSPSFIDRSEEAGLDYAEMYLLAHEVERAKSRDTVKDVAKTLEELSRSHSWSWLGEEGKRIQQGCWQG